RLTPDASDLVGVDPMLGPLQDNGGQTFTRALLAGSPAIDSGGACAGFPDQRGVERPQGGACDIGAFEFACGNGTVDLGETCDDGNASAGDCCSADCQIEPACPTATAVPTSTPEETPVVTTTPTVVATETVLPTEVPPET